MLHACAGSCEEQFYMLKEYVNNKDCGGTKGKETDGQVVKTDNVTFQQNLTNSCTVHQIYTFSVTYPGKVLTFVTEKGGFILNE